MKVEIYWVKYRLQLKIKTLQDKADYWFNVYNDPENRFSNTNRSLMRYLIRAKKYQNRVRGLVMALDLIINMESERD